MDKNIYSNLYQKLISISYKKQDHWDIFNAKYYEKIKDIDNLIDFRNNGLSNMLETGLPSQEQFVLLNENKCYNTNYSPDEIEEIINRYDQLNVLTNNELKKYSFNNNIGNPKHYLHENIMLNFDDLYHIYAIWQMDRTLTYKNIEPKTVVEIGGGYGNFANKYKTLKKNTKYVIIDLPEVLLLQNYYLNAMNSEYKIINLIDSSISVDIENDSFDFLLLPYNIYENFNFPVDVVINKRSLGEMPKNVLDKYFKWIQSNLKEDGLFYVVNRYAFTKSNDKNKFRDYPFDKKWNILLSQPQWLQTHLHEFILQRVKNENDSVEFLLKSFPLSTPPPGPILKDSILKQSDWLKYQNINNSNTE